MSQGVNMKLPKKVLIEGIEWMIVRKWRIVSEGTECDGLCVHDKHEIWVLHGLEEAEAFRIFIHEYLHAILYEKGIYLTGLSDEAEEMIVHGISKELCQSFNLKMKTQREK